MRDVVVQTSHSKSNWAFRSVITFAISSLPKLQAEWRRAAGILEVVEKLEVRDYPSTVSGSIAEGIKEQIATIAHSGRCTRPAVVHRNEHLRIFNGRWRFSLINPSVVVKGERTMKALPLIPDVRGSLGGSIRDIHGTTIGMPDRTFGVTPHRLRPGSFVRDIRGTIVGEVKPFKVSVFYSHPRSIPHKELG
jgi:hypothetical protein